MIKTPSSTVIGGAGIWTPGCTVIGSMQKTLDQLIKSLFADGTQGLYLNAQDAVSVSDLSSIKDLSGNNNHAVQANAASRASLITDPSGYKSLKFDGIDDGYVTPSINFSNTDKVTVIAAVRKLSDAAAGIVAELSADANTAVGSFYLAAPSATNTTVSFYSKGLTGTRFITASNLAAPLSFVASCTFDMRVDSKLRVNSQLRTSSNISMTGTGLGNYPLYIGRRGLATLPFNGQIYALLVIGKILDDVTTQRIEKEFSKYVGVTL